MRFWRVRSGRMAGARLAVCNAGGLCHRWVLSGSTPIAEELDLVAHTLGGRGRPKMQDSAHLFSDREPLLGRQNHSSMFSPSAHPLEVKPIEIRDVKRIQDTPMAGRERQLFVVRLSDEASVQGGDHVDATRTKGRDKIAIHRVFVNVDFDLAHRRGSAPVLFFEGFCLSRL